METAVATGYASGCSSESDTSETPQDRFRERCVCRRRIRRGEARHRGCRSQRTGSLTPESAMNKIAPRRPVFAPSPDALAERGADALRRGRFKEATEIFKQLVRQDPQPEWRHRLADAYAGRARALAEKGMFKEAAMVLENTLAADGTIREPVLYLSCLIRQGQHQKARRVALASIARLPAPDAARLAEFAAALSLACPRRPYGGQSARRKPVGGANPRGTGGTPGMAPGQPLRRGRSPARRHPTALAIRAAAADPEKPDHPAGCRRQSPRRCWP